MQQTHNSNCATIPQGVCRASDDAGALAHTDILGIPVSRLDLASATRTILDWAKRGRSNFVCVRDVHGIMRARRDMRLRLAHRRAGMVTPDGMPLVWLSRVHGHSEVGRVCGADLVDALCKASADTGVRHYFYGGKPGVAKRMANALRRRYPGLDVAGVGCPPFQKVSAERQQAEIDQIAATHPHIVWIGMSTPKQELWMHKTVGAIPGATLIGVGAAFDYHTGSVRRAPLWMQRSGLEWLHRLASEPRRLWRRYLVLAPQFVFLVAMDALRARTRPA